MKDKHINIAKDSNLLKQVYDEVENKLHIDKQATATLLTVKFIFYFSLVLLTYFAIYFSNNTATLFSAYILFGLLSVLFGFNFAHDFCHNTVFKSKRLNNFGFTFIYTLVGAHAEAWKFRHIHSHHYAPNVKDYDTDLQITSLIRVEPNSEYKWFHKYQQFYAPLAYTSYSLYWVFIKDFVVYFTDKENLHQKEIQFHISFWLQKLFYVSYLLILPILFSGLPWFTLVLGFISMHLIQSLFLLFTFFMTHHVEQTEYFNADDDGYIKTSWFTNQIKSSNDFHPFSKTANFIFGGFNNHIAHHLFPHIHHVHYPQLNKILYKILSENNIKPNVTTFMGGIVSHLRHLKTLSIQP
ncbi:MAG TPA: fatty acid desaturase [Bacteroidia bacterium]|nr:fatty acid desaturase [Bacteroidia bacterium]